MVAYAQTTKGSKNGKKSHIPGMNIVEHGAAYSYTK
jgi:hypothetical protein